MSRAENAGLPNSSTIEIGGERQLFLDDQLLDLAQSHDVTAR